MENSPIVFNFFFSPLSFCCPVQCGGVSSLFGKCTIFLIMPCVITRYVVTACSTEYFGRKDFLTYFYFNFCKMCIANGLQVSIVNLCLNFEHGCYCTSSFLLGCTIERSQILREEIIWVISCTKVKVILIYFWNYFWFFAFLYTMQQICKKIIVCEPMLILCLFFLDFLGKSPQPH